MNDDLPNGHLATVDGDLDDLTGREARQVPAGAATRYAVLYIMGFRLSDQREPPSLYPISVARGAWLQRPDSWAPSRTASHDVCCDPEAAHRAREWLAETLAEQYVSAEVGVTLRATDEKTVAEARCSVQLAEHPPSWSKLAIVRASTPHLATARLILVLYAKGKL